MEPSHFILLMKIFEIGRRLPFLTRSLVAVALAFLAWGGQAAAQGFGTNQNPSPGLRTNAISGWDVFHLGDPYPLVVSNLQTRYPWMESTFDLEGDVSLPEQRKLIILKANRYFSSVEFHFRQERLFNLRLVWNPKAVSFIELIRRLTDRYGEPDSVTFPELGWRRGSASLVLERPNTVKYLDLSAISNQVQGKVSPLQKMTELERDNMLKGL